MKRRPSKRALVRLAGDVELVPDVAVHGEPLLLDGRDRLARELERNRLVAQEAAGRGLRDHGALVADDGVVEAELAQVRPDRLEHAPRDDEDANAGRTRRREGRARARAEHEVLADQRPVEVAGEGLDRGREVVRKGQRFSAMKATRSASCWSSSCWP